MSNKFFFSVLLSSLLALPALALVPPAVYLSHKLTASIGANPCVQVDKNVSGVAVVPIRVCSQRVGEGLVFVLKDAKFKVLDRSGKEIAPLTHVEETPEFVMERLQDVLEENPYLVKIYPNAGFGRGPVIEFKKQVIQFFVDNIGDLYGNVNFVAADLFRDVFSSSYFGKVQLSTTTSKE